MEPLRGLENQLNILSQILENAEDWGAYQAQQAAIVPTMQKISNYMKSFDEVKIQEIFPELSEIQSLNDQTLKEIKSLQNPSVLRSMPLPGFLKPKDPQKVIAANAQTMLAKVNVVREKILKFQNLIEIAGQKIGRSEVAKALKNASEKADLLQILQHCIEHHQWDEAITVINVLKESLYSGTEKVIDESIFLLMQHYVESNQRERAVECVNKLKHPDRKLYALTCIADLERNAGKTQEAIRIKKLHKELLLFKEIEMVRYYLNDLDVNSAAQRAANIGNIRQRNQAYLEIAHHSRDKQKYPEAIQALNQIHPEYLTDEEKEKMELLLTLIFSSLVDSKQEEMAMGLACSIQYKSWRRVSLFAIPNRLDDLQLYDAATACYDRIKKLL